MKADPTQDTYFYITGWIFIGLFAALLFILYGLHFPLLHTVPPCMFHALTGLYCPGCGGTRAVFALLHGQVIRSLYYHPIVLYVAVFGGWFMITQTIARISRHKICTGMHYRSVYVWITIGLIAGNFLFKNALLLFTGNALMG